ncbi:pathogenicity island protein [Macrococcus armenti]|uniref:pathogenicity island protein n=1 Tax=Macrococcus armenti TaxID=2875764 RepID=UPI001CCEA6EF|nr:pathogenicity island protein [Macrococcus armenti]UBH09209.1 pathogenicity island protein [Macrococcus armenti]UBH11505.1 pathogenicity island protein [Macrococcus armenti]UBH15007.1 pathogenicity island protein [Macrococcus armenti]UBH17366.1 pathogenicity island protein [Macrococcus armenti]UBH19631.1 pathogenicity island protein [Macrococcus armenti]
MKLLRCKRTFTYKSDGKLSEYQLLRDFSPVTIRLNIAYMSMQINEMYHLSVSHTTCSDVLGVITIGTPVETLACWIIEQKQALERYKQKSNKNMHLLKTCLYKYSKDEQREVKRYLSSNGRYGNSKVIERLKRDLYQATTNARIERNKARERERLINIYKHTQQVKQALHTQREVLSV